MHGTNRFTNQVVYDPGDLNLVGKPLNASSNSAWMECAGFNQLTLEFDVAVWSAASAVTWFLQTADAQAGTNPRRMTAEDLAATGIGTMNDHQWSRPISSSAGWTVNIPINCSFFRINALTGTGGAATELVTVRATLGVV